MPFYSQLMAQLGAVQFYFRRSLFRSNRRWWLFSLADCSCRESRLVWQVKVSHHSLSLAFPSLPVSLLVQYVSHRSGLESKRERDQADLAYHLWLYLTRYRCGNRHPCLIGTGCSVPTCVRDVVILTNLLHCVFVHIGSPFSRSSRRRCYERGSGLSHWRVWLPREVSFKLQNSSGETEATRSAVSGPFSRVSQNLVHSQISILI